MKKLHAKIAIFLFAFGAFSGFAHAKPGYVCLQVCSVHQRFSDDWVRCMQWCRNN
jgi:hypothetical protein